VEDVVDASSEVGRDRGWVLVGAETSEVFVVVVSVCRLREVVGRAVVVVVDIVDVDAGAGRRTWSVVSAMDSLSLGFVAKGNAASAGVMSRCTAGVVLRSCEEAMSVERVAEADI